MRKYYPIWKQLKEKANNATLVGDQKKVAVVHPAHLHSRLVKAVLKERTMDTGFRYELAEADKFAKIFYESIPERNIIVFELKFYLDPTDI